MASHAIPQGSTVLVTGGTGFVGAHVLREILRSGYRVRAAVRASAKAEPIQKFVESEYGKDKFESVVIEDFTKVGAFDEAVKGVSGIAHCAMSVDPPIGDTYEETVHQAVEGALSILRSAAAHGGPELKRVVLTSSSVACGQPSTESGGYQYFDSTTWNTGAAEKTKKDLKSGLVYSATKYESEKAVWDFVKKEKPSFVVNAINPNANFGPTLPFISSNGSTHRWIQDIANGDLERTKRIPAQWFIDVRDTAILHRIALTVPAVQNERIWLVSEPFTWNQIIALVNKFKPGAKLEYLKGDEDSYDHTFIDNERTRELIRTYGGRPELRTLKQSVQDHLAGTV